ncbi:MAG TPA: hypothetical protein PKA00_01610 [Saprospiraceae bacterium]|nr:hypothetical protein [Saprospiraceae bacterium]HMQ81566.1 hypothetical protein [Saprospiraceae bacterium]
MTALSNRLNIPIAPTFPSTLIENFRTNQEHSYWVNSSTTLKDTNDLIPANRSEIKNIKSFLMLEENFDSYGSEKVAKESVEHAIEFIKEINKMDVAVAYSSPGPNKEVLIVLGNKEKEIEFIFYPSKAKFVRFEASNFVDQGVFEYEGLVDLISWLF